MLNKTFSLYVSKLIKPYKKIIQVDSDKSISIRSFLIGAISHNVSEIKKRNNGLGTNIDTVNSMMNETGDIISPTKVDIE